MNKPFKKAFTERKRGQATPFIIVGIVLVIAVAISVFYLKPDLVSGRLSGSQIGGIDSYLEDCVEEKLEEKLIDLKTKAGRDGFDLSENRFQNSPYKSNAIKVGLLADIPSKVTIERSISAEIKAFLEGSCSLDDFKDDFKIEQKGAIFVRTIVGLDSVTATVTYPLEISRGDFIIKINQFSIVANDDFGKVLDYARCLSNGFVIGDDDVVNSCSRPDGITYVDQDVIEGRVIYIGNVEEFEENGGNFNNLFRFMVIE